MRLIPRLHFDFAAASRSRRPQWLLLSAGLLACLLGAIGWFEEQADRTQATQTAAAQRASAARAAPPARLDTIERRLALPWGLIMTGIDKAVPEDVVLVSVEPDADKGRVQIGAEARSPAAMTAFVAALGKGGAFASATLVSHQVRVEEADKPLRFAVAVQWRGAP